jgi:hypothetical protein
MDTPNASSGSWDFAIVVPLPLPFVLLAPTVVPGGGGEANPAVEAMTGDREDVADDTEARVIGDGTGEKR